MSAAAAASSENASNNNKRPRATGDDDRAPSAPIPITKTATSCRQACTGPLTTMSKIHRRAEKRERLAFKSAANSAKR